MESKRSPCGALLVRMMRIQRIGGGILMSRISIWVRLAASLDLQQRTLTRIDSFWWQKSSFDAGNACGHYPEGILE